MIPQPPAHHAPACPAIDRERMLLCIAEVESANRWVVGTKGERTPWQITREVWAKHAQASDFPRCEILPRTSRHVAECHLADVITFLARNGYPVTPGYIAMVWRLGSKGCNGRLKSGRLPDSAQRVANLYNDPSL